MADQRSADYWVGRVGLFSGSNGPIMMLMLQLGPVQAEPGSVRLTRSLWKERFVPEPDDHRANCRTKVSVMNRREREAPKPC